MRGILSDFSTEMDDEVTCPICGSGVNTGSHSETTWAELDCNCYEIVFSKMRKKERNESINEYFRDFIVS